MKREVGGTAAPTYLWEILLNMRNDNIFSKQTPDQMQLLFENRSKLIWSRHYPLKTVTYTRLLAKVSIRVRRKDIMGMQMQGTMGRVPKSIRDNPKLKISNVLSNDRPNAKQKQAIQFWIA